MYGLIDWASVCFRQSGYLGVGGGARAGLSLRSHVENALGELAPLGTRAANGWPDRTRATESQTASKDRDVVGRQAARRGGPQSPALVTAKPLSTLLYY